MNALRRFLIHYGIAAVWLANGLLCKVLGMVPRHRQIVARICGAEHAATLTVLIGWLEIGMAVWILSRYQPRLNAGLQIAVVAIMNTLEYLLVPELLLWGRWNAFFALLFVGLVYLQAFVWEKHDQATAST